jgi:signal transduction histidine kinase
MRGPPESRRGRDRRLDDLAALNRWLCGTRLTAAAAVAAFAALLHTLRVPGIAAAPVVLVCAVLAIFSLLALRSSLPGRAPRGFFYLQNVVDLGGIAVGLAAGAGGTPALLFRLLFVMVIVPASLVSVGAGLVVATLATIAHEILLAIDRGGASLATLTSIESLAPAFLFYLVARQSFFYGGHLERKNDALGRLADRLEDSRARLAALVDVARTLNSTLEASTLRGRVNRAALAHLSADWSATFLLDTERGTFRAAATAAGDAPTPTLDVDLPARGWAPIDRLTSERVTVLSDPESKHAADLLAPGLALRTIRFAGLYRGDALVGVLAVGYREAGKFGHDAALQLLAGIAEHATIALSNAELLEEARRASALKSEFVSTMSHELRTPLNVMIGYAEMLRDGAAGPLARGQADLVDRLDARTRELLELIEATLQVGRLEAGRGGIDVAPVPLSELVDAVVASVASLPRPTGVELRWEPPAGGGTVTTDRAKVVLIVRNLVSNAFKFTAQGEVTVRIQAEGSELRIVVRDTGIGIAEDQLPVIFEMFRQLGTGPADHRGGVGLGLYIVQQFVDRLRGTIEVESAPGRGTTFRVILPGYARDGVAPQQGPGWSDQKVQATGVPESRGL